MDCKRCWYLFQNRQRRICGSGTHKRALLNIVIPVPKTDALVINEVNSSPDDWVEREYQRYRHKLADGKSE